MFLRDLVENKDLMANKFQICLALLMRERVMRSLGVTWSLWRQLVMLSTCRSPGKCCKM